MASSVDLTAALAVRATASLETASIAGVVRFLCDARLATLAVVMVVSATRSPDASLLIMLLAVPLSWMPLRHWAQHPMVFARGTAYLLSEAVMTLMVLKVGWTEMGERALTTAYLLETAALFGVLLPLWRALALAAATAAGCMGVVAVGGGESLGAVLLVPAAALTCYLSGRLGQNLRRQGKLAERLVELRSREAVAGERAALAREMHDSTAKTLHGVRMLADSLAARLHDDASPHAARADVIFQACDTAVRETRDVLGGLRALATDRLADAVRLEVRMWQERTGIPAGLEVRGDAETARPEDADTGWRLVRILGELLENVERHAAAHQVWVVLQLGEEATVLTVRDDGRGMGRPLDRDSLALGGHYGLIGVQERAAEVGGCVTAAAPASGAGTQVTIQLPRTRGQD
ncbi:sensor histidine kinase [Georgenia sp. SYP-B2076]|uniref:sensor histidine kinase n=1 Tax=Georgenia sp. SYP-B2076 TaxID=2495881 RepID=UPI000F8F787F|nr:histidine kinase [Georgenia sp. SYP-B2076]